MSAISLVEIGEPAIAAEAAPTDKQNPNAAFVPGPRSFPRGLQNRPVAPDRPELGWPDDRRHPTKRALVGPVGPMGLPELPKPAPVPMPCLVASV